MKRQYDGAYFRVWYKKNRARSLAHKKKWRDNNPDEKTRK